MRLLRVLLALGAAALLQMLLSSYAAPLARYCDLFTIVVVYYALTRPSPTAMTVGSGAGLIQDSLIGPILGLNGFKKTLIGYLVGTVGSLFMLNQAVPRFGILFVATLLDPLTELGLSMAMGRSFAFPGVLDLIRLAVGNGVFGLMFFWLASKVP